MKRQVAKNVRKMSEKLTPKQRRERILELIREIGLNKTALARKIGVNERTIYRDLKVLGEQIQKIPRAEYTLELTCIFERLQDELWNILNNPKTPPRTMLQAIGVFVNLLGQKVKLLKELGLIPEKVENEPKSIEIKFVGNE